ncbi:hypothetical protein B0H14DRAFT_2583458 [Mycena olivaceomarginata]|nr:hypothetical protein B0H14DRAFT_2583458 [Mycena olivaceomarginata]
MSNSPPLPIANSAVPYDTLHWDKGSKFGHHHWVLIKQKLAQTGKSEAFDRCMAAIPRWCGFDRIKSAATLDYVEGNTHLQLLKKSPLIHSLRTLQQFRILVGLHCTTESRLKLMDRFVKDYEMALSILQGVEGKNFDFLKQHYTQHVLGATHNMMTRTGKGFQQESHVSGGRKDPANEITLEQIIKNKADWSPQHNILHCSPLFHGKPRYDCLLFNAENNPHSLTHLISLLRSQQPNKDVLDLAYVRVFKSTIVESPRQCGRDVELSKRVHTCIPAA